MRVAALLVVDAQVVLVRHRAGESVYHLLPGGGVDYRETIGDALVREVAEETGLDIEVGRPLLVSDTIDPEGPRHVVNLTFSARAVGGRILASSRDPRVEAIDLVPPARLAELDLRPPMADQLIRILTTTTDVPAEYLGSIFTSGH